MSLKNTIVLTYPSDMIVDGLSYLMYHRHGECHRIGSPAYVVKRYSSWLEYGQLHRKYGPATTWNKKDLYYIRGNQYDLRDYNFLMSRQ